MVTFLKVSALYTCRLLYAHIRSIFFCCENQPLSEVIYCLRTYEFNVVLDSNLIPVFFIPTLDVKWLQNNCFRGITSKR